MPEDTPAYVVTMTEAVPYVGVPWRCEHCGETLGIVTEGVLELEGHIRANDRRIEAYCDTCKTWQPWVQNNKEGGE